MSENPASLAGVAPYYLGWDRSGNAGTGGVGIHHPSGDIKKISTYSATPITSTCMGSLNNYFWKISFISTANGYSVMEPGSSGSALINSNKKIIGQLYGPGYCTPDRCNNPSNQIVSYGKFNVSWTGNNNPNIHRRLDHWLDPLGTSPSTLDGRNLPSILCFGPVCNSGKSVTMFNVPAGASIFWNQSSNISRSSPQSSNPCTFSASGGYWASGAGSIGATVVTASGDSIIVPPVTVWTGVPDYNQLSVEIASDRLVACGYTEGEANFNGSPSPGIDAFQWDLDATDYGVEEVGMSLVDYKYVEIHYWEDPAPYDENIWISAHNQCGWSMSKRTTWLVEDECENDWYLVFSPNPATGETMLTIESNSTEKTFDFVAEWDLEIYTQTQMLKDRKTKLKGNSTTINTSGWKEGVYVARVKYKDEVLTGKLVVKL